MCVLRRVHPLAAPPASDSSSSPPWALIGPVAGVGAVAILVAVTCCVLRRRKQQGQGRGQGMQQSPSSLGVPLADSPYNSLNA